MQNFTTYVYIVDNKVNNLVNIHQYLNDVDEKLLQYLSEVDLEPNDELIDKTITKIKQIL